MNATTSRDYTIQKYRGRDFGNIVEALQWKPGVSISGICRGHRWSQSVGTDHDFAQFDGSARLREGDFVTRFPDGHLQIYSAEGFFMTFIELDDDFRPEPNTLFGKPVIR